jgi:sulfatase-like protein
LQRFLLSLRPRLSVLRHPALLVSVLLAALETVPAAYYGRFLVARDPLPAEASFVLSFAGTAASYLVIIALTARWRWLRRGVVVLITLTTVALELIYFGIYRELSTLPTVSIADFARQNSRYACALFFERLDAASVALSACFIAAVGCAVRRGFETRIELGRGALLALGGVAVASHAGAIAPFLSVSQQSARLLLESSRGPGVVNRAWTPDRERPRAQPAAHPVNILLFRLEEVAARATSFERPELATTPLLRALLERRPEDVFLASRHYSNSTATDVSVLSLFTGLSPAAPLEAHRHIPILWDYFAAAGYDTSLFIPDHLRWGDFERRFQARPGELNLSKLVDASNAGRPLVYDHSLNDVDVVADALRYQNQRAWAEPFLQVVSLRMPHAIGEGARVNHIDYGAFGREPPELRDYYNAIRHDDQLMTEFIAAIPPAVQGRTLLVITSDHGTRLFARDDGAGELPRLDNYHVETTRVPLLIVAPPAARERLDPAALARLQQNFQTVATSNIDVVPTLLGLAGIPPVELDLPHPELLLGRDLTRRLPPTEAIVQCNTGPLRRWDREHFALILGNGAAHYFFSLGREHGFLPMGDPLEASDVVAQPAFSPYLGEGRALAALLPELTRIRQKYLGLAAAQPIAAAEAAADNPAPPPTRGSRDPAAPAPEGGRPRVLEPSASR